MSVQLEKQLSPTAIEAHKRVNDKLVSALADEAKFRRSMQQELTNLKQSELEEEEMKEMIKSHHSHVLRMQIREQRRKRMASQEERRIPAISPAYHGYPDLPQTPDTIYQQRRVEIFSSNRKLLDDQVNTSRFMNQTFHKQEKEADMKRINNANLSLRVENQRKEQTKNANYNVLKKAWNKDIKARNLGKVVKRAQDESPLRRNPSRISSIYSSVGSELFTGSVLNATSPQMTGRSATFNRTPQANSLQATLRELDKEQQALSVEKTRIQRALERRGVNQLSTRLKH